MLNFRQPAVEQFQDPESIAMVMSLVRLNFVFLNIYKGQLANVWQAGYESNEAPCFDVIDVLDVKFLVILKWICLIFPFHVPA